MLRHDGETARGESLGALAEPRGPCHRCALLAAVALGVFFAGVAVGNQQSARRHTAALSPRSPPRHHHGNTAAASGNVANAPPEDAPPAAPAAPVAGNTPPTPQEPAAAETEAPHARPSLDEPLTEAPHTPPPAPTGVVSTGVPSATLQPSLAPTGALPLATHGHPATQSPRGSGVMAKNPYMAAVENPERVAFQRAQQAQRHANSVDIAKRFGSYCQGRNEGQHCFQHLENQAFGPPMETCPCDEHPWDNRTNWEVSRSAACADLNARKEARFPMPKELRQVLEIYGGETGTAYDPPVFDGGGASGDLPFTPAVVRDHFYKLRAALVGYYEDSRVLTEPLRPRPDEPEHASAVRALAAVFARAMVAKDRDAFVIGILGDSTAAGADNCFFDSWGEQLRRQLGPLLLAAGLRLEVS